jgi:hypothetical protein
MAELVLRAAWPNGDSGGARTRTGWRAKILAKGRGRTCLFRSPWPGRIFFTIRFTVLLAVLPFGVRAQHETGDIAVGITPGGPAAVADYAG